MKKKLLGEGNIYLLLGENNKIKRKKMYITTEIYLVDEPLYI